MFGASGGIYWYLSPEILKDLEEGEPGEWLEAVEAAEVEGEEDG